MAGWISVEDPPKDAEAVWVYDLEYGVQTAIYYNGWWSGTDDRHNPTDYCQVTHWQPIHVPFPLMIVPHPGEVK